MKINPWLLVSIVLCLAIACLYKCDEKHFQDAALVINQSTKELDSLQCLQLAALDSNISLNIRLEASQRESNRLIDSLSKENKIKADSLRFDNTRAKNLIATIHDYAKQNKDSVIERLADSLEQLRGSVEGKVIYVFANDRIKDSINRTRNVADSIALDAKDTTIAVMSRTSKDKDAIIARLQATLDHAIKTGKRKNILRTIGEIFLVGALIFKK